MALALRGKRDKLGKGPWGSYGKSDIWTRKRILGRGYVFMSLKKREALSLRKMDNRFGCQSSTLH